MKLNVCKEKLAFVQLFYLKDKVIQEKRCVKRGEF